VGGGVSEFPEAAVDDEAVHQAIAMHGIENVKIGPGCEPRGRALAVRASAAPLLLFCSRNEY
jgi:hypothetical protein